MNQKSKQYYKQVIEKSCHENCRPAVTTLLAKEVQSLRKLLWLKHGCSTTALYGDEGEMQCGACIIDFKRDPIKRIEEIFNRKAFEAARQICGQSKSKSIAEAVAEIKEILEENK